MQYKLGQMELQKWGVYIISYSRKVLLLPILKEKKRNKQHLTTAKSKVKDWKKINENSTIGGKHQKLKAHDQAFW